MSGGRIAIVVLVWLGGAVLMLAVDPHAGFLGGVLWGMVSFAIGLAISLLVPVVNK